MSKLNSFRNELGYVSPMLEKVTDRCRRDMGILLRRRDDDGLDVRSKLAVGISYRPFRLEIDHIPDSTHYMSDAEFMALVYGEVVILYYADTFQRGSGLAYDIHPLVVRKESALVYIDSDCDHHFVKHGQSPLQDIEMTCSKRIE